MIGTSSPNWRAWIMMLAASSASADTISASGASAAILVSCAEKSVSPLAKVSVATTSVPLSANACAKTS